MLGRTNADRILGFSRLPVGREDETIEQPFDLSDDLPFEAGD